MTLTSLGLDLVGRPAPHGGAEFALARLDGGLAVVVLNPDRELAVAFDGEMVAREGRPVLVGPRSPRNAAALRERLPWLRPAPLGLHTSAGFGDRLGLATPGHIAALRSLSSASAIAPIFAQQSMREMSRTGRSAQQVVDEAMWSVFAEGWREGYGADADHLKQPADIDTCLAAGFTFFTFDPGEHVTGGADAMDVADLRAAFEGLPWQALEDSARAFEQRWRAREAFDADGHRVALDSRGALVAAVKYGRAVAHVAAMSRHLAAQAGARPVEVEVSLDETETRTSHGEHLYVATELRRLGVRWVSLAPRFVGRFEKGVDYIGELAAFERDVAVHAALARTLGPYKLSLHSGSDKFAIYEAAARETRGLVHLKTAGTSWLEALRTIAKADPRFFADIYAFARERYETDRASYHVSATLDGAPSAVDAGSSLEHLLDDFDARQILHVTFGSVLTAKNDDGTLRFGTRLMALLGEHPDEYSRNLERHFRRHLVPFAR